MDSGVRVNQRVKDLVNVEIVTCNHAETVKTPKIQRRADWEIEIMGSTNTSLSASQKGTWFNICNLCATLLLSAPIVILTEGVLFAKTEGSPFDG